MPGQLTRPATEAHSGRPTAPHPPNQVKINLVVDNGEQALYPVVMEYNEQQEAALPYCEPEELAPNCFAVSFGKGTSELLMAATINGKQFTGCLVDTGCQVTALSEEAADSLEVIIAPSSLTVEVADGHHTRISGVVQITVVMGLSRACALQAIVLSGLRYPALIGVDFLASSKAILRPGWLISCRMTVIPTHRGIQPRHMPCRRSQERDKD